MLVVGVRPCVIKGRRCDVQRVVQCELHKRERKSRCCDNQRGGDGPGVTLGVMPGRVHGGRVTLLRGEYGGD